MYACKYCGREAKSKQSAVQHEIRCPSNASRLVIYRNGFEGYNSKVKAGELPDRKKNQWDNKDYVLREDTRQKIRETSARRIWTEDEKKKNSERMKKAVRDNPEAYTASNRGRSKLIFF